ncbi:MAG: hypothetical protein OEY15_01900 [Myxococcales bacterium]|nr:hypothetical protein [Myxococcales bacterium]
MRAMLLRLRHDRRRAPRAGVGRACALSFALLAWLPRGAAAEAPDAAATRWTPAFSLGFDVQNQGLEADLDSSIGLSASSGSTQLSSLFRLDGTLYTPSLLSGAGAPRLLLHAGAQIPLAEGFLVLRANEQYLVGTLEAAQFCPLAPGPPVIDSCDQKGRTDLRYDVAWSAGLGVEFTLPLAERQIKLRPSIDYFGQSLQLDSRIERVDMGLQGAPINAVTVVQTTTLAASRGELVHAIGPRLSVDVETGRIGRFSLNVFVETQFYWIVSNRTFIYGASNGADSADFRAVLDPLVAQGGAGLRIVWSGD